VIAPQDLVEIALAASTADACVVVVEEHSEINLRWAANALTTNGLARARTATVISIVQRTGGRAVGIASGSVTDVAEAIALARAADAASRESEPVEESCPLVVGALLDVAWGEEIPVIAPERLEPFTRDLASACARWRSEGRLLFGYAEHQLTTSFLGTSTGLRRRFDQLDGRLELTGKSGDLQRSAWSGAHIPDPDTVDLAAGLRDAERGLAWASRQVALPPGPYETILPPSAVADLMLCAYGQMAARDAAEGRSAFAAPDGGDRIGEQLTSLPLTLYSDPAETEIACAPFDLVTDGESSHWSIFDNGQPLSRTEWIDRGRISELIRTRAWAERSGAQPRPMIANLILDGGGEASLEEMVASTDRGLLLTSLWYIRDVDPQSLLVTGLTRDGVYLVEGGEVTAAVNNFRFNDSPLDLLRRVTEVGRTEHTLPRERADVFRRTAMPPLRVPDFGFSTVSNAR
jgi:predicted Zn-dependent protease